MIDLFAREVIGWAMPLSPSDRQQGQVLSLTYENPKRNIPEHARG
ncbi:hypothetical protein [uncultured Shewanella sp.]|nr:hypothetical protein [uncultured Shewanella sp.]